MGVAIIWIEGKRRKLKVWQQKRIECRSFRVPEYPFQMHACPFEDWLRLEYLIYLPNFAHLLLLPLTKHTITMIILKYKKVNL